MPKIAVVSVAHIHSRDFCKTIGKLVSGKAPHVIWDENPERGAKYAAEFNCPFEPDLDKVVADPAVEAFVVTQTEVALAEELVLETQQLAALEGKQKGAVAGDAIGVFLIGVPVSSLTGGDVSGHIATSKGKVLALEARVASCG